MSKKPSSRELRAMVLSMVARQKSDVAAFEGPENPQVVTALIRARERLHVAEAVLAAMEGDRTALRLLGYD